MNIKLIITGTFLPLLILMACLTFNISQNFQLISVYAELGTLLILLVLNIHRGYNIEIEEEEVNKNYYFLIYVIGSALIGILNIYFVYSTIDFSEINSKTNSNFYITVITLNSSFITIGQVGGWFIQLIITILIALLIDLEISLKLISKLLSVSYFGFFIGSVIGIVYNTIFLEHFSNFTELNDFVKTSHSHLIIGKLGEFLTLAILASLLNQFTKNNTKSLLVAYLPNILLMIVLVLSKILA